MTPENHHNGAAEHHQRTIDELDWLKRRVAEMGYNGDCAYERALATEYKQRIERHLGLLRATGAI